MRRISKRRAKRIADTREWRFNLTRRVGHCEACDYTPPPHRLGWIILAVHEIARGCHRDKALDKLYAVLVVCPDCHMGPLASKAEWPEARQLAALKRSRPQDYDLPAYNTLVGPGPKRVTQEEVDQWEPKR